MAKIEGEQTPEQEAEEAERHEREFAGQSTMLAALGVLILWFGWYGFNCGSTLAFDGQNAGKVATTTTLGAAAGGLCATFVGYQHRGYWPVSTGLNGVLAGLVSITAPCSVVDEWHAVLIGAIGGIIYYITSLILLYAKIDDPLNAFPVHGACGVWGCLAVGLFAQANNVERAYGGEPAYDLNAMHSFKQFGVQLAGITTIVVWTVGTTAPLFFVLNKFSLLRISRHDENIGIDKAEHGSRDLKYRPHGAASMQGALFSEPVTVEPIADDAPNAPNAEHGDV